MRSGVWLILLLGISTISMAKEPNLSFAFQTWMAVDSDFWEYPTPGSADQSFIWGRFDTTTFELSAQARIFRPLCLEIKGHYGLIASNNMYLSTTANYLIIGGDTKGFHANIVGRVLEKEGSWLDIYAGFAFSAGMKTFTDYQESGTVVLAGNFGYYAINLFGPQVGLKTRAMLGNSLSLFADLFVSPYFENNSVVAGWSPQPLEESAKGYRYGFETILSWAWKGLDIGAGCKYEFIYYAYGTFATHDLNIKYGGPVFRIGYQF